MLDLIYFAFPWSAIQTNGMDSTFCCTDNRVVDGPRDLLTPNLGIKLTIA
jgi:hypothetical protein